jgi:hypothetical protein
MKNKTTIVIEVKEGLVVPQNAKSSNVILLYYTLFNIFPQ